MNIPILGPFKQNQSRLTETERYQTFPRADRHFNAGVCQILATRMAKHHTRFLSFGSGLNEPKP
jgi:hypothetical protein